MRSFIAALNDGDSIFLDGITYRVSNAD
jgi:hypothetical protein